MSEVDVQRELQTLRADVVRLRRLVALFALPWLLVVLGGFAEDGTPDEIVAHRFVVVDEEGVVRAELGAPVVDSLPGFHSEPERRAVPALKMHFHDGSEIRVGGTAGYFDPQVRLQRGDKWSFMRAGGFTSIDDGDDAAAFFNPYRAEISVDHKRDGYRSFDLDAFDEDGRASITVTNGDEHVVFPAR